MRRSAGLLQRDACPPASAAPGRAADNQRAPDIAVALGKRRDRGADGAWSASLSRKLLDSREREALLADRPRSVDVPPGEPTDEEAWMAAGLVG